MEGKEVEEGEVVEEEVVGGQEDGEAEAVLLAGQVILEERNLQSKAN